MTGFVSAVEVRRDLMVGREIALIDLRDEADFALGHPLFAAQIPLDRLALEAPYRIPRRESRIVVYDDGEALVAPALESLRNLGYTDASALYDGLSGWRAAGFEVFKDVNSYSKAFGELVEHSRHTPSLTPEQVKRLMHDGEDMVVLDARPFVEYTTMAIPGAINVPGGELVLRARALAPDPRTRIVVNCAGRTRSLIGAQSLINSGIPNRVEALRNGTIGWTLAGQHLAYGQTARFNVVSTDVLDEARNASHEVAYKAGVRWLDTKTLDDLSRDAQRTLYRFDVRTTEEYEAGHLPQFCSAPGGQLVQEIDLFAPVRGARILLADDLCVRSNMTASWLAQMGWEAYVLNYDSRAGLETGSSAGAPPRSARGRYKRPYEGTDNPQAAMQSYLDWEYGLVAQLARDSSHGFFVI